MFFKVYLQYVRSNYQNGYPRNMYNIYALRQDEKGEECVPELSPTISPRVVMTAEASPKLNPVLTEWRIGKV
ncbi:MAG: hypothetical protein ACLFM9_03530 [Candidatus Aenigmatarchaeota archaeon]